MSRKRKKKTKTLLILLMIACLLGMGFMVILYLRESAPKIEAEKTYDEIRDWAFPVLPDEASTDPARPPESRDGELDSAAYYRNGPPDFNALSAWNSDIVGWIYSPGTTIDYPIVKGMDNDYYLNHTIDRKRSVIGSIFMEYENAADFTDDVTVLYGHHIRQGRMFSSLSGYKQQSYYEKHPSMILFTRDKTYDIQIFAGNVVNGEVGEFPLRFKDDEQWKNWLNQCLQNSTFHSRIVPDKDDKIIVLCTCTYEYQNARYIVYGILKEQEVNEVDHDQE